MNVVKDAEGINDYDYNKMMSDFETTTRHEEHLKKIKKKWVDQGRKFRRTIERMKLEREEHYQEKNKELERKLKQKNQTMLTALNSSNQAKMAEKKKNIELLCQKEKQAKENVEKKLSEQEQKRLLAAELTHEKSKYGFNNK